MNDYTRVTVSDEPDVAVKSEVIVQRAFYKKVGGIFNGDIYVAGLTDINTLRLINLRDGNRWNKSDQLPPGFTRILPGSNINIKVGE